MCARHGVGARDAARLAANLHRAGALLHFSRASDPALRGLVFLHAEEVMDAVIDATLGVPGPRAQHIKARVRARASSRARTQRTPRTPARRAPPPLGWFTLFAR